MQPLDRSNCVSCNEHEFVCTSVAVSDLSHTPTYIAVSGSLSSPSPSPFLLAVWPSVLISPFGPPFHFLDCLHRLRGSSGFMLPKPNMHPPYTILTFLHQFSDKPTSSLTSDHLSRSHPSGSHPSRSQKFPPHSPHTPPDPFLYPPTAYCAFSNPTRTD